MEKPRLLRVTTVPISLRLLLRGQLGYMQNHGFEVLTISADGPEVAGITSDGQAHMVVPFTRQITPLQDLICLIRLMVIIRKFKPHVVHTHTPKAGLLGMMAAWCCGVKVRMHTVAGLPYLESTGLKKKILRLVEYVTYKAATKIYPNSLRLAEFLKNEFPTLAETFRVIGNGSSNGIDTEYFSVSKELTEKAGKLRLKYHIGEGDLVFSFVGRIVTDKGINELVKAFDIIRREFPTAWLLLVGSVEERLDPLWPDVSARIAMGDHIISPGFQEDVRPWIAASEIFVFPSYREGFPNVLLQACSLEKVCIATDINGCNEIVEHHKSGLLIRPKDVESLALAMRLLAADNLLRQKLVANARELLASKFSQAYIWNEILMEYQKQISACIEK